jgi:hypothetical protein
MKRVAHTLLLHLFFILLFAFLYHYFATHFNNNKQSKFKHYIGESKLDSIVDFLLFSTTIQAGVGISDMMPISVYGKILTITQQLIMMSITVLTLYVFTN